MNILINSGRTQAFLTTRRMLISSFLDKGHQVVLTGYQEGYEKEIEELGASFVKMDFNRAGFNPFKDLGLILQYYRVIKKENIDLVHSYTIKPNIYGSIAARLARLRHIYPTLNGIGYAFTAQGAKARITRFFASILYWIAFKYSKSIFFHNKDDIDLMVDAHLTSKNKCVLTLGSGIDMDDYPSAEMPEKVSFVLISRLLKAKGIVEYITAAQKVKQVFPEVMFKLVGPTDPNPTGIEFSKIQTFIDNGVISYYGNQSDVRPFIRESSVLVLPSYREGLPHTVLEGMSIGRAILTTDVPGCRETVVNGENGFLVRPYSSDELAEKMIWMIKNPERIREMGRKSLLLVKENFDVKKVNRIILNTMNLS